MNIFKRFKTTFNPKVPKRKTRKEKGEPQIQCLKYRIYSEFTTEHVFDTNPRHLPEKPFTPTQSKKLHVKSLSENNLSSTEKSDTNPDQKVIKNGMWPSENDLGKPNKSETDKQIQPIPAEVETTNSATKKKDKGILKNKNERVESELYNEDNYAKTNFNEEVTYEQYEPIDDELGEEDIYYFEQREDESSDKYVVHKSPTVHFTESDHEYEEPIHQSGGLGGETRENPVYRLSTHPKLNPTVQGTTKDEEYARSIGLNTFGNTKKLGYPGDYSLEAASIFFESQDDHEC
ncbi:uncharacterized protein LOC123318766 [Coccinella septempunctata]|uniref:uncharacterized protein LOC123318766 n=1 Tax=Coccinella septempunctata TaxID=41139 RepID=UPI001D0876B3|nr:uncharacterized protein LOC123318766 [Coccinella septempunctata]